jgi:hypothetical protein
MSRRTNDEKVSDLLMASTHQRERREVRYALAIAIFVSGIDRQGRAFHERTSTTNVSAWGCGFRISVELDIDDIVALQASPIENGGAATTRQSLFQIVRVNREADGWTVGAWKVDSENFWGADIEKIIKGEENSQAQGGEAVGQGGDRDRLGNDGER